MAERFETIRTRSRPIKARVIFATRDFFAHDWLRGDRTFSNTTLCVSKIGDGRLVAYVYGGIAEAKAICRLLQRVYDKHRRPKVPEKAHRPGSRSNYSKFCREAVDGLGKRAGNSLSKMSA